MASHLIHLKPSADGSLSIPAELVQQAGLKTGKDILLRVGASRLTLLSPLDTSVLFEAFKEQIQPQLSDLNAEYRMSDGRTIKEYLALAGDQQQALWEEAFREAIDELEKEPEQDASPDYVSAGQGHRAPRV